MIRKTSSRTSLQISLYLDDRLDGKQRIQLERRIAEDENVRSEFEELRRMRDVLAAREPLPANPFLLEKIMNRIDARSEDDGAFTPLPRRYMPAMTGAFVMLLFAAVAFAWVQRDEILRYIGNTGSQMQTAYEDTILKGWIMPLFQRTDQDQVLQFAMFGTLPLDETDGTLLRVDENAERGYQLELASNTDPDQPLTTMDELYREIQPTAGQRKVFDTLFLYAQRKLESAVLMNKERQIAIDPAISKYNKVILSGIAANLEPEQLARFENFLEKRNTTYTLVSHRTPVSPPAPTAATLMERFRTVRAPAEFVVLDDDGYTVTRLHLDMDSLRRLMKVVEQRMPRIEFRVQDIARSYAISGPSAVPEPPGLPHGVRVMPAQVNTGTHSITITIDSGGEIMREMERDFETLRHEVVVLRRQAGQLNEALQQRHSGYRSALQAGQGRRTTVTVKPDSESMFRVQIDTSIDEAGEHIENLRIDIQSLIENAPPGSKLDWQELIPVEERSLIDSVPPATPPQPVPRDSVIEI